MEAIQRYWFMLTQIPRYPMKIDGAVLESRLRDQGYKVTRRTIQRDLGHLSGYFPLQSDEKSKPYGWSWSRDAEGFSLPGMSPSTALTLRLVDAHLAALLPASVRASLQPYIKDAGKVLDRVADNPLRHWPEKIRVIPAGQPLRPAAIREEILAVVYEALLREQRFSCRYRSLGTNEAKEQEFNPLALVSRGQTLYLIGTFWDYDEPVLLRPERLETVELLDKPVTVPEGFDLDEYVKREMQFAVSDRRLKLELLFDAKAGRHLLETPLSDDQQVREEKDGKLRITATALDTRQLRWWLQGFGGGVEVVKPKKLRDEFAATARTLAEKYR